MKLRKCSLLQRPRLVSGLRHGLEMSIRFATVYRDTYEERNNRAPLPLFRIEIHLFDRFPRLERERTTTSIERFHGIRRKIRGIVNVATSRVAIFTDIPICLEEEAIFIASDLYASPRCIFIVFRFSTFFFFFIKFLRRIARLFYRRIMLFVIVLIDDASYFYSRYF